MLSDSHQVIVRKLVERGASTRRFRRAVIRSIRRVHGLESALLFKEELDTKNPMNSRGARGRGIAPDAYCIDEREQAIVVFEVEHANALDANKLEHYIHWWWMLDELFWSIRLIGVRCWSGVAVCHEVDLRDIVYATLSKAESPTLLISRSNCRGTILDPSLDAPGAE